jgi:hypothetical protein
MIVPLTECPKCGRILDTCSGVSWEGEYMEVDETNGPGEGDYTVCVGCGTLLRFNKDLQLEKLTQQHLDKLKKNKEKWTLIKETQNLIRKVMAERQKQDYGEFLN